MISIGIPGVHLHNLEYIQCLLRTRMKSSSRRSLRIQYQRPWYCQSAMVSLPNFCMLPSSELWVPITLSSSVCLYLLVSEMAKCLPEGVLQELHCLLQSVFIEMHVYTKFRLDW